MNVTWQDLMTAGLVLLALVYFARYLVRLVRRKGAPACRCCQTCPMETPEKTMVKLDNRQVKEVANRSP
jgi:hypothetical protein